MFKSMQSFSTSCHKITNAYSPGKTLVVARYQEDISWLPEDIPVILYCKDDIPDVSNNVIVRYLDNVGRESHSYLTYIVDYYDTLDEIVVFAQGNPYPHCCNFHQVIKRNDLDGMFQENSKHYHGICSKNPIFVPFGFMWRYDPDYFWETVWEDQGRAMTILWNWLGNLGELSFPFIVYNGAQFAVSREGIRSRPVEDYVYLLELHYKEKFMPWAMEIMWPLIFDYPKLLL